MVGSATRLLIGKGSLPGVAPLGRPAIQPAWTLLEGSDRWGCRLRHTPAAAGALFRVLQTGRVLQQNLHKCDVPPCSL